MIRDYSSRERDTDREDELTLSDYRPPRERMLAVERQVEAEKISQILVDEAVQREQVRLSVDHIVQDYPGIPESKRVMDSVEIVMGTEPEKMFHAVKVPPTLGGTVSSKLKNLMGVANIRAKTRIGAVPIAKIRAMVKKSKPAQGLPVTEKGISSTPVKSLNLLDQFFNYVNALLKVK